MINYICFSKNIIEHEEKIKKAGWTVSKAEIVDAPVFDQLPLTLAKCHGLQLRFVAFCFVITFLYCTFALKPTE